MLLGAHTVDDTTDFDSAGRSLFAASGGVHLELADKPKHFFLRANLARLGEVSLLWIGTNGQFHNTFGPTGWARRVFQIRGRSRISIGRRTIECSPTGPGYVAPADSDWQVRHGVGGFEALSLRVPTASLSRKLQIMTGSDRIHALEFAQPADDDAQKSILFRHFLFQMANEIDYFGPQIGVSTTAEFEQELICRFLLYSRHRYSGLLDRVPALASSAQLRRIVEYIRANLSEPLDTGTLGEVGGISGRSVHRMFCQYHACSPQEYVKQARLERAHSCLSEGVDATTVMEVALRCGFHSLGHFARSYRRQFGELPSATLRRSAARRPQRA